MNGHISHFLTDCLWLQHFWPRDPADPVANGWGAVEGREPVCSVLLEPRSLLVSVLPRRGLPSPLPATARAAQRTKCVCARMCSDETCGRRCNLDTSRDPSRVHAVTRIPPAADRHPDTSPASGGAAVSAMHACDQ